MGVSSQAFGGSNLFHAKLVVVHGQLKLAAGIPNDEDRAGGRIPQRNPMA
jgi:hypothetical protein